MDAGSFKTAVAAAAWLETRLIKAVAPNAASISMLTFLLAKASGGKLEVATVVRLFMGHIDNYVSISINRLLYIVDYLLLTFIYNCIYIADYILLTLHR